MKTPEKLASKIWTKAKGLAFLKIFLRQTPEDNFKQAILPYWISAIHEILKSSGACDCENACWLQRYANHEEKIKWAETHWCKELSFETFWREVIAMYLTAIYFKKMRNSRNSKLVN